MLRRITSSLILLGLVSTTVAPLTAKAAPAPKQNSTKNEKRQITAGFAGGALVLLLLGAAMSLRWFGRLI